MERLAYRPEEVAQLIGLSTKTIYRMAENGSLPFKQVAGAGTGERRHIVIPADALKKWLSKGDVPRQVEIERRKKAIAKSAFAKLRKGS